MPISESESASSSARDDIAGEDTVYINHCSVSLSLTTAELNFGQASAADQSLHTKRRLVTSAAYFRHIGEIIRTECELYDNAIHSARSSEEE